MPRIDPSEVGATPYQRLLGHNPAVLGAWTRLEEQFLNSGRLPPPLLEQVRRTLACHNGCQYCLAKAGPPAPEEFDGRTRLAARFAEQVVQDYVAPSDREFAPLREAFSEGEIAELVAFICFTTAAQRFGAILNLTPEDRGENR